MNSAILSVAVGIIFIVLGIGAIFGKQKFGDHPYFKILAIVIAIILIAFGIYFGWRGIEKYG
ncbi:MAG TPA: hypothetical protein VFF21_09865 [Flavobacteriaceae bacterium]|nr:hypothetical protein [Flavobacteriaceae bacterium]